MSLSPLLAPFLSPFSPLCAAIESMMRTNYRSYLSLVPGSVHDLHSGFSFSNTNSLCIFLFDVFVQIKNRRIQCISLRAAAFEKSPMILAVFHRLPKICKFSSAAERFSLHGEKKETCIVF